MSKLKKIFSVVLSCAFLLTLCNVESVFASDFTAPEGKQLTSLKQYNIAPGVKESHITMVDSKGDNQVQGYAATIDLTKKAGIMAGYKDYSTDGKWGMQTVRDQAAAAEKKTGKNIVMATNGDYYNMSTGEPTGILVMNGKVVKSTCGWGEDYYYFAIKKDGTATIRSMQEPVDLSDVKEAVGGPIKLVTDGKVSLNDFVLADQNRIPRNAVGIKENGEVVFFGADGRQAPKSVGMTMEETAQTMVQLGCKEAIYIDGGGSYTYASKSEGSNELTVKNSPSDGIERKVSSSFFVYSDAKKTGEFDHAAITPDNEVYTPGSKVKFEATGVDSAGGEAKLPSDAKFALKDSSMGTITEDGSFTAGDKTGTVEVQLKSGSEVVGSTTIEVQQPDSITFANEEVALGFSKESDLGLTVRYKNRQINYNDDDFEWSVTDLKDADKKDVTDPDKKLGTFKGNKFTSSDGATLYGTVHCAYKKNKDVKGSVSVVVGLQPTVAMDFEDKTVDGKTIDAKDYWTFNRAAFAADGGLQGIWDLDGKWLGTTPTSRMVYGHYLNSPPNPETGEADSRGGNESAEVVDISSGEPVRKGNHSLRINYDFSNVNGTEGACVGFSDAQQQIPGNPTAIGMYIYAPEGTPNLWPRIRLKDGNGTILTLDFTAGGCDNENAKALGGIDWTGWKYVEAKLVSREKDKDGNVISETPLQGPFSLIGGETVRIMYQQASSGNFIMKDGKIERVPKSDIKGHIYVDNVQFIYGANTTDTDNPLINSVSANGVVLNNKDEIVKSNEASFEINVTDVENKYTTGIDYDTKNIWIDGKNITQKALDADKLTEDQSKDTIYLNSWHLSNGTHTIKVLIRDKEGNETTKKYTFDVDGSSQDQMKASVTVDENSLYLGKAAILNVNANKREWTDTVSTEIELGAGFEYKGVEYGEGFQEAKAPVYDKSANSVEIFVKKKADATVAGEGTIATVKAEIPSDISKEKKFSYAVNSFDLEYTDESKESQDLSFTKRTQSLEIKAKYEVAVDDTVAGEDTKITVTDESGKPAKGIGVYTSDGEKLGDTDNKGTITTSKFRDAQKISVYAKDGEGMFSFIVTSQSFNAGANEDGTPTYIQLNASKNSETAKNITWMSNPSKAEKKAVAMVARKSDYEAKKDKAFQEYKGTCERLNFGGSSFADKNKVVWANTVEITGLEAGSDYVYKVGDGEHWSDVRNFSTCNNGEDTKFFLLGDTQADDKTVLNQIMDNLKNDNYAFGVQTGDFVEKADLYDEWVSILELFNAEPFNRTDMIHVAGNHEFYGDTTGTNQKKVFNIENQQHYSVTYGNVYVAVLGYDSSEKGAKEDAEWLVSDASKSNAKWKIVLSHQPPYGTNKSATDCNYFNEYIPEACDQAGIDFMFSGHDHSLVRTKPLTNNATDEKNGVVYYVCGSTGGKSYAASNSDKFAVDPTKEYDGIYFTMNATDSKFTVDVYNADGTKMEDYCYSKEKVKDTCQNGQHDYESTKDRLVCKNCGTSKKINKDMTFLVTDKSTGVARYLKNGEFLKNSWIADGKDYYYMDKDGYAETGTVTIDGRKYTFNKKGLFVKGSFVQEEVTLNDGSKKTITRYYEAGGSYARRWREVDGNMYYFRQRTNNGVAPDDGEMYVGVNGKDTNISTPGDKKVTTRSFKFGSDGALIRGAFENETDSNGKVVGTRYYWGNDYVTGSTTIEGVRYDFDSFGYMKKKSLTKCTVSVPDQTYTGKALTPKVEVKDGDQTLTENVHYKVTYKDNKNVGTATATVKGVSLRGYTGSVEVTFKITKKSTPTKPTKPTKVTAPSKVKISSVKNIKTKKAKVTWKKASNASGYKVYRATSSKGKYKCVKTTGSGSRSWTNSKLKKGKTYYYKVRAYRKASGKTVYGSYSSVKKIKIKK